MNIVHKTLASIGLAASLVSAAWGLPIVLPDPNQGGVESGSMSITADQEIAVSGSPISLTTSKPSSGDPNTGAATFKDGTLEFNDGVTTLSGHISRVVLKSVTEADGSVSYALSGVVYGTLNTAGGKRNVNGNFSVTTTPAAAGEANPNGASVSSSHLLVNPLPENHIAH